MYEDDDRRLDAAVALGIITAEQAAQVRALTPRRSPMASAPRSFGGSVIAYALGAITVLIAMGWFLADRWDLLGPAGVLAVVGLYGLLFTLVAWRMRREGFPVAEGLAALLAVAMVPLAVVAANELLHWLPEFDAGACGRSYGPLPLAFDFWRCRGLELSIELALVSAALLAWRLTHFSLFALVVGGVGIRGVFHLVAVVSDGQAHITAGGWVWMMCASILAAIAYGVDRRPDPAQDVGLWVHLLAAFSAAAASVALLNQFDDFRHLLLPAAFVAFAFSLRLRRGAWTLLGLAWFVSYLGWLAVDVFKDTPVFPIVLAALGIGVIVATVWVQRNREAIAARFGGLESGGTPSFPGGVGLLLLPALVAALQLPSALALDRALRRDDRASAELYRLRHERERREAQADSARRETAPAPQP